MRMFQVTAQLFDKKCCMLTLLLKRILSSVALCNGCVWITIQTHFAIFLNHPCFTFRLRDQYYDLAAKEVSGGIVTFLFAEYAAIAQLEFGCVR